MIEAELNEEFWMFGLDNTAGNKIHHRFLQIARAFPTPGASTTLPIVGQWSQNPQIFRREAERFQAQLFNISESCEFLEEP